MSSLPIALPRPRPQLLAAKPPHVKTGHRTLFLALMSGGLLWLCYFPVAWGWLGWLALTPLLALVRSTGRPWLLYQDARVCGWYFFLAAIQWMRVADPRMYATWIGLAFYCSLYFPFALYLVRLLDRRTSLPLTVTVPMVWTALEFLRSTLGGGFSWYLLGHSQHDFLPIIQVADITGAYGVSFLIAAVNGLLFEMLYRRAWFRSWLSGPDAEPRPSLLGLLVQAILIGAALLGALAYGYWRLGQDHQTLGPRLALVQGNLDQRIRNESAVNEEAAANVAKHFIHLADLAARYHPDLIVWPETSYPDEWTQQADGTPSEHSRQTARRMARRWRAPVLIGINSANMDEQNRRHRFNSAILIDGKGQASGRYDKIHRVPFGEYVPFRDWLPWMEQFAPYDFDYSIGAGQEHTRFTLADVAGRRFRFGVLICYEDTDAAVARPYGGSDGRAAADFLLNISNDGWFNGTSEHDQHLAICRFRAIECRRSVARSVNMGISAVIDSNGRVLASQLLSAPDVQERVWTTDVKNDAARELPVSRWHEYKKVPGVLLAVVPIDDRVSIYSRCGDWLPWGCWIGMGVLFIWTVAGRGRVRLRLAAKQPLI